MRLPSPALTVRTTVRIDPDMARPSNKEKLLSAGLVLMHERGFGASSVRDIVKAAGVPQGSFTNHFASKDAFGLAILARYREMTSAGVRETLRNDDLAPLRRLRAWIDRQVDYLRPDDMRRGCLYGNLSAEASEVSDEIRGRVAAVFAENQASVAYCLNAAIDAGELPPNVDARELAGFIVSSLQGALLVAKAQRSPVPVERFERVLFQHLLQQGSPVSRRRRRVAR
jgi:TetR/AcrR family transcriptional repressor of nem operon